MRVAIICGKEPSITVLAHVLPEHTTEIVFGDGIGIADSLKQYAATHHYRVKEFLPDFQQFGERAFLERDIQMVTYADVVYVFWDGADPAAETIIQKCRKSGIPLHTQILY